MSKIRFIGLDVHADSISVAIAEPDNGEVRSLGAIPAHVRNIHSRLRPGALRRVRFPLMLSEDSLRPPACQVSVRDFPIKSTD